MSAQASPVAAMSWPECLCGARDYIITLRSDRYRVYGDLDAQLRYSIARCRRCALSRTLPVGEEVYAGPYRDPDAIRSYLVLPALYRRLMEHTLLEIREICPSGRLLDIGCSVGTLLGVAAEDGYDVTGLELNLDAVEVARERLGAGSVLAEPLETASLPPGYFDVIVMSAVAEHILDLPGVLRRCWELLRPGGAVLLANSPNWGAPVARLGGAGWYGLQPQAHVWQFTVGTLSVVLERAGYRVVLRRTYPLHREYHGALKRVLRRGDWLLGKAGLGDALSVGGRRP
ncbi:MAG: class I SAM-dependent methyltransferase [Candidatus Dormibacteria bacterium]